MKKLNEIKNWEELKNEVVCSDCLEGMKLIPDGVVDAVICDPPYGTTACSWDTVIPFDKMWEQINRIIKPNGAIVLFGSEPFSSALRMSNIKNYKYDWIWKKQKPTNFYQVKWQPLKEHENISVFCLRTPNYNPQGIKPVNIKSGRKNKSSNLYSKWDGGDYIQKVGNYPRSIIVESTEGDKNRLHPTQKPIALIEYLIKTYTNEGEMVVDFTMGSWTTGKACKNLNRDFIGFELSEKYCEIGEKRLQQQNLF